MIVYNGPSMLDGKPIVGIITGLDSKSKNPKTGPMLQLWILVRDKMPHDAVKSGEDESVCGDCPARGKWCYVTTFQGPLAVWKAYKARKYGGYDPRRLEGHALRLGAYGDPAALPLGILGGITAQVDRYTGYTHAWKYCDPSYMNFCMASCDTREEQQEAAARGWRTFRLATGPDDRLPGEAICPASEEQGHKLTCYECGACDGTRRDRVKGHIVIQAHGSRVNSFREFSQ